MADMAGPFKIILSELAGPAAAELGNPAADRVQAELARLLDLDEGMAASIVGAMPIVIVHGLSARQAGAARERLQILVQLGCKVVTTDEAGDTLPHVNWPVVPQIAQVEEEQPAAGAGGAPSHAAPEPGTLTCPSCFSTFRLSPTGAHAHSHAQTHAQPHSSGESREASRERSLGAAAPPSRARAEQVFPSDEEEPEDDWMSPPVTRVPAPGRHTPAPEPSPEPSRPASGGTARFNEAALLAYARADEPPPPPPAPPPPAPLHMSFSDTQVDPFELGSTTSASGLGPLDVAGDESSFEATGSLHDSGSDILDLEPPHREAELERERSRSRSGTAFEDDFDLLGASDDGEPPARAAAPARAVERPELGGSSLNGRELLDDVFEAAPARAGSGSFVASGPDIFADDEDEDDPFAPAADPFAASFAEEDDEEDDPFSDQEFGRMLASDDDLPGRASPAREPAKPAKSKRGGDDDLDDVLRLFGPEDEQPLDDLAGLEPAPLDLSPRERRPNPMGSEFQSDILEPLNPSEAMEIIKSQKTRGGSKRAPRGFEEDDDFDLFGDSGNQPAPSARASKKKPRGVPFSASGEDLDLFEDSRPPARAQPKERARTNGNGGGADPFARARQAMDDERGAPAPEARAPSKRREGGRSSSRRSGGRGAAAEPRGGGGGGGGGPAPTGAGDHGLVLSRIADPDKKEKAAELIAEIKGCNLEDAARLTDRTIIPVLKGVSRDVAEFHLEKFRRYKIAGRVTTRQRS